MRYFAYREAVALAEKGLVREGDIGGNSKGALRWGIILAAIGLALLIGLYPLGFLPANSAEHMPLRFGPWMLIGLVPLFWGFGLLVVYRLTRPKSNGDSGKKE